MPKFLVLYRSSMTAQEQMSGASPEQMKAGMDAWMGWARQAGSSLVDLGAPLAGSERIGGASGPANGGHITGFSILDADSVQAASALVRDHPHLQTPGGSSIEVLEFAPMPGMG